MSDEVLAYYEEHAQAYAKQTQHLDMSEAQRRFQSRLKPGARVLDAGCGSGRDSLAFLSAGLQVDAIDGSQAMVAVAQSLLPAGTVRHMRFDQLELPQVYDGVWACASLVHMSRADMAATAEKLVAGLKPGGVLFLSLKAGDGPAVAKSGLPFQGYSWPQLLQLADQLGLQSVLLWPSAGRKEPEQSWWSLLAHRAA